MSQVMFKGKPVHTSGAMPSLHKKVPDFLLVDADLQNCSLRTFSGKKKLISTVPSLDTGVCSTMTKKLNEAAKAHPEFLFLTVSADLPFAQKRFCEKEEVQNSKTLSMMRNRDFGRDYGLLLEDGPLAGLLARAILIVNEKDELVYCELVSEITKEPDYSSALRHLKAG